MNKKAFISGLIGAAFGFIFSGLINYYLLPFPETIFDHALSNGLSGMFSGFMGGFMAIKTMKK